MSVLELNGRPFVVFNPENKEHRYWYHQFVVSNTWGRCPFRFVVPDGYADLITLIERALVKHYVQKEFKTVAQKQHVSIRQKKKKTVDKTSKK